MKINVLTLFPEMFDSVVGSSIWARAAESGAAQIKPVNIRGFSTDKHNRADDYPFGGGHGMVLKPEPVSACFTDIEKSCPRPYINVYMTPGGQRLTHSVAVELSQFACVNILCGHYEGVDARAIEAHIDMEISLGDYVLTGGELAAMVLIDTFIRHVDGVLGNEESADNESFAEGLLEHPQYTRPAEFEGRTVPEVLLSGHHAKVAEYNRRMAIYETALRRPDMLSKVVLSAKDIEYITEK